MSELNEPRWAVISERGIETSNVTYSQALELVQTLGEKGIHANIDFYAAVLLDALGVRT